MKIFLALLLLFCACAPQYRINRPPPLEASEEDSSLADPKTAKIVVFDVGEGSSTLIVSPDNSAMLIDVGPISSFIKKIGPYLGSNDILVKEVFLSHSDSDHSGGLEGSGLTETPYRGGDTFTMDGIDIDIIAKDCIFKNGESLPCETDNEKSGVFLITFGGFKLLITGDLPGGGGEGEFATRDLETAVGEEAGDVDLLIVGHHGSNTSTNDNLLALTSPSAAIISVGNNNSYWHPHKSTIERLLACGIDIYLTNMGSLPEELLDNVTVMNGDVVIETDGKDFEVY